LTEQLKLKLILFLKLKYHWLQKSAKHLSHAEHVFTTIILHATQALDTGWSAVKIANKILCDKCSHFNTMCNNHTQTLECRLTDQEHIRQVSTQEEEQKDELCVTEQDCPLLINEILLVPKTSTNTVAQNKTIRLKHQQFSRHPFTELPFKNIPLHQFFPKIHYRIHNSTYRPYPRFFKLRLMWRTSFTDKSDPST